MLYNCNVFEKYSSITISTEVKIHDSASRSHRNNAFYLISVVIVYCFVVYRSVVYCSVTFNSPSLLHCNAMTTIPLRYFEHEPPNGARYDARSLPTQTMYYKKIWAMAKNGSSRFFFAKNGCT